MQLVDSRNPIKQNRQLVPRISNSLHPLQQCPASNHPHQAPPQSGSPSSLLAPIFSPGVACLPLRLRRLQDSSIESALPPAQIIHTGIMIHPNFLAGQVLMLLLAHMEQGDGCPHGEGRSEHVVDQYRGTPSYGRGGRNSATNKYPQARER